MRNMQAIDFTNMYFYTVAYHAYKASNLIAIEKKQSFDGFEKSKYATGQYFLKYIWDEWKPKTQIVSDLFEKYGIYIPTKDDWNMLAESIALFGMYNQNLQAVPPTGSIS